MWKYDFHFPSNIYIAFEIDFCSFLFFMPQFSSNFKLKSLFYLAKHPFGNEWSINVLMFRILQMFVIGLLRKGKKSRAYLLVVGIKNGTMPQFQFEVKYFALVVNLHTDSCRKSK